MRLRYIKPKLKDLSQGSRIAFSCPSKKNVENSVTKWSFLFLYDIINKIENSLIGER